MDPWAAALRRKSDTSHDGEQAVGVSKALEEQVVQSVLARIPASMTDDDTTTRDDRLNALEAQVQQLTDPRP